MDTPDLHLNDFTAISAKGNNSYRQEVHLLVFETFQKSAISFL